MIPDFVSTMRHGPLPLPSCIGALHLQTFAQALGICTTSRSISQIPLPLSFEPIPRIAHDVGCPASAAALSVQRLPDICAR